MLILSRSIIDPEIDQALLWVWLHRRDVRRRPVRGHSDMRGAALLRREPRSGACRRRLLPVPPLQRPTCRRMGSTARASASASAGSSASAGARLSSRPTVTDGVLTPELLRRVAPEVAERGAFLPLHGQPAEIRTDQVLWLNEVSAHKPSAVAGDRG